jgi:hypothetical protein
MTSKIRHGLSPYAVYAAGVACLVACGSSEAGGGVAASGGGVGGDISLPGAAGMDQGGEAGEVGNGRSGLESAAEQQAIIDRTKLMSAPSGVDPTVSALLTIIQSPDSSEGAGGASDGDSYYDCAQKGAAHAYPARRVAGESICSQIISEGSLTDKMLVAGETDGLLIAFAGTQVSLSNPEDLVADFESQATIDHQNPLFEHTDATADQLPADLVANSGGSVGRGWEARWRSQLKEANLGNLYKLIKLISDQPEYAPEGDRTLTITVVGHSLGAVVAELAAYDIYDYLRDKQLRFHVRVVGFNPPKLGSDAFVAGYRYRLLHSPENQSLEISQFSRSYDVVPKVPAFLNHPVWQTDASSKVIGEGSDETLPYCPQYALDVFHTPLDAHSIDAWTADIAATLASAQCLFGSQMAADEF